MTSPKLTHLIHADWSVSPRKRWRASAAWRGHWIVETVEPVGEVSAFLRRMCDLAATATVLAGFDFPIGLPAAYGAKTGVGGFRDFLAALNEPRWSRFGEIAREPSELAIERPFYPAGAASGIKQADLLAAHGVGDLDGLRRASERKTAIRRAACPIFWTLGGNQVGRAALSGWREVIRPGMRMGARLWPFEGDLDQLLGEAGLILVETYPAEAYVQVGVGFLPGESKTSQSDRIGKASAIFGWADANAVILSDPVSRLVLDGFGADKAGEDRFDAFMGLAGMIEVASGCRPAASRGACALWEGWIFGQSAA